MDSSHGAMDIDSDPRLARKRVPRACDQCRRRKSRCDGQTNCSACRSIGLSCSYGQTVKQVRGPSYIAHLERTVEELQNQTRRLSAQCPPDSRRQSPASKSPTSPTFSNQDEGISPFQNVPSLSNSQDTPSSASNSRPPEPATTYVEIIAREPRAKSFGSDVLRQLTNFCYDLPRPGASHRQDSAMKIVQALDAPFPHNHYLTGAGIPPLPHSDVLFTWIELAFSETFPLWHFVDKAYIESILPRMWSTSSEFGQDEGDKDDLGLLYAVLALGQRFEVSGNVASDRRMQGLAYFAAAGDAVPLACCERSIPALQTVLCMALYLMAASCQARTHAYAAAASSAALRMGLHEQVSGYPQEEQALRRRVWFVVHAMDVYASGALGLPSSLSSAETQNESFGSVFPGMDDMTLATAAHHQLMVVVENCVKRVYRDREARAASSVQSRVVSTKALRESAEELETWANNCAFIAEQLDALALSASDVSPAALPQLGNCTGTQLLLCYAHCYAQLQLYTPLVHHLAQPTADRTSEAYHHGTRCVRAALVATHVAEELLRRFQLNEAYFQTVDVIINALLVLLTVELGSSDGKLLREAIPAGRRAKEILLNLVPLSVKAAECWEAVAPLFQSGKGDSSKARNARKSEIRDSFRISYNAQFGSACGIDPLQLWTNEPIGMPDDGIINI